MWLLPPHFLQKKTGVCVFVCLCALMGVKALVGKQTKTHALATVCSLASRHPPHHKPQLTSQRATHTHTPTPSQLLPQIHTDMPGGLNHLLYCSTRSPKITSQSKIICYYCPAAPWHCAINKAIVEARSLFGHHIIDSLTDLLCSLSLRLTQKRRTYSTLLRINRWVVCLPRHSGLTVNTKGWTNRGLHKGTVPDHTLATSSHTFTNTSCRTPLFISLLKHLVFLVPSVCHT